MGFALLAWQEALHHHGMEGKGIDVMSSCVYVCVLTTYRNESIDNDVALCLILARLLIVALE